MGIRNRKILILGCDARVGVQLCLNLGERGFTVLCQGFDAIEVALSDFQPDLVVARPPEGSAVAALARVHERSDAPIMLLLPAEHDRDALIRAFRAGADDVVMESSDLEEVVMRVEAILRRAVMREGLRAGDIVIDTDSHTARRGEHNLELTDIEFDILAVLVRNAGTVVSKRQLLADVWGFENYSVNVAEVHVSALRRKLNAFGPPIIDTVRSRGYVIRHHDVDLATGDLVHPDVHPELPLSWMSPEQLVRPVPVQLTQQRDSTHEY